MEVTGAAELLGFGREEEAEDTAYIEEMIAIRTEAKKAKMLEIMKGHKLI